MLFHQSVNTWNPRSILTRNTQSLSQPMTIQSSKSYHEEHSKIYNQNGESYCEGKISKIRVNVHIGTLMWRSTRNKSCLCVVSKVCRNWVFVARQESRKVSADEETVEWIPASHCTYKVYESQKSGTADDWLSCSLQFGTFCIHLLWNPTCLLDET
jgi:hypothetical protein